VTSVIAHFAPARGFPLNQVIPATAVFAVIVAGVTWASIRYRRGRAPRLQAAVQHLEQRTGLPAWLPAGVAVTTGSLVIAVLGFYWDVAVHIDKGRDDGPFGTPAHYPIIVGLLGIALAGVIATVIGSDRRSPTAVRLTRNWSAPVGGLLLAVCGMIALAGFPLDDVWHTLFGQDVTLWSPTHIQMIGGASLATLAMWVLLEEGRRSRTRRSEDGWLMRNADVLIGSAFLVGLSTLQAEFDYGVPQFRQLYHPVLIMLAAGIGLVAVRIRGGRGAALKAAGLFLGARVLLAVLIGPLFGRSILHFPLYLPEALLVEGATLVVTTRKQLTFGLASGVAIGTVGLAAEWGWSQAWAPLPWHVSLLPDAAVLGFVAAVAGSVIGAFIGRALLPPDVERQRAPRLAGVAAWAMALAVLVVPFHMTARTGYRATVGLIRVPGASTDEVSAVVSLDPPGAAVNANWFDVTDWQGGSGTWGGGQEGLVIRQFRKVSPGIYRTDGSFPVGGNWKALIRLHTGNSIEAVPVFLPRDPAIPAPGVPATANFTRSFVADKQILQREATGGSPLVQNIAYALCGLIAVVWVASLAWGLHHLETRRGRVTGVATTTESEPLRRAG
jgi:hypothetical protein